MQEDAPRTRRPSGDPRPLALEMLRRNRLLQAAMVAALVSYGGVVALLLWRGPEGPRLEAGMAAWLVGLSLATWSLLFWWLPVLDRTGRALEARGSGSGLVRMMEVVATACIVIVHALFLAIVVLRAAQ
ncbi:MAG: hypothetical protein AB7T63_15905 [Planctomycetota bacterium]